MKTWKGARRERILLLWCVLLLLAGGAGVLTALVGAWAFGDPISADSTQGAIRKGIVDFLVGSLKVGDLEVAKELVSRHPLAAFFLAGVLVALWPARKLAERAAADHPAKSA